jgi:hypothetical protein
MLNSCWNWIWPVCAAHAGPHAAAFTSSNGRIGQAKAVMPLLLDNNPLRELTLRGTWTA